MAYLLMTVIEILTHSLKDVLELELLLIKENV